MVTSARQRGTRGARPRARRLLLPCSGVILGGSVRLDGVKPRARGAACNGVDPALQILIAFRITQAYVIRMSKGRVVAYVRVSTDKQADEGVSLQAQRAKVRSYAELYGLELVELVVDAGESAKTLNRPGLQRALGLLRTRRADGLLVVKLDRLTRSVRDLSSLLERYFGPNGAALMSVEEQIDTRTPAGKLVLNILASVSQWEREETAKRTASAMKHKRSQGEYTGGDAPFGYRLEGGRLVPRADEQAIIREACALRARGLSLRAVANGLHGQGLRSRVGGPFEAAQVARMVRVNA